MSAFTTVEQAMHTTDLMLIGTNALIVVATIILAFYTAKAANETAREMRREDGRIMRMLIRRNRKARHARRQRREQDNVRKLG